MRDIRFISGDSESLILETLDGEKLRLTLDETVRAATKTSPEGAPANTLSPREVQDAIRDGVTVEELAASSGDSTNFIRRFAAPVLEELAHMVASALSVRIEIAPDRYNEARHQEFGELISDRLRNSGAAKLTWKASRQNATTWLITVQYETPAGEGSATWTYDPRRVVLSPENEAAINLSNSATMGDVLIQKLLSVGEPSTATSNEAIEPTKVTDLLDAFKQRREAAEIEAKNSDDHTQREPEISTEPELPDSDNSDQPPAESNKKGRAPMPSWDEIVFGSKSED